MQGRFTSADPLSGNANRPQSWNLYAYVRNNPLKLVDPTGMSAVRPSPEDSSVDLHSSGGGALTSGSWKMDETVADSAQSTTSESIATTTPGETTSDPQNSQQQPQITPCDQKFADIFGGDGAVARTVYEFNGAYRGRDPDLAARGAALGRTAMGNAFFDAEHLYNFPHLSGNLAGTANTEVYVPGNYTGSPTGPTKGDAVTTFYYKNFFGMKNVTLAVFHVADFGIERMNDGRVRIGTTGGPGGNSGGTTPNLHSHFELWRGRGYRPPGAGRDGARIPLTPVICN